MLFVDGSAAKRFSKLSDASGWTEAIGTDGLPLLARGCLTESGTTGGSGTVISLGLDLLPPALGPKGG